MMAAAFVNRFTKPHCLLTGTHERSPRALEIFSRQHRSIHCDLMTDGLGVGGVVLMDSVECVALLGPIERDRDYVLVPAVEHQFVLRGGHADTSSTANGSYER